MFLFQPKKIKKKYLSYPRNDYSEQCWDQTQRSLSMVQKINLRNNEMQKKNLTKNTRFVERETFSRNLTWIKIFNARVYYCLYNEKMYKDIYTVCTQVYL